MPRSYHCRLPQLLHPLLKGSAGAAQTWIASYNQARGPIAHYLYSRATKQARLLFVDRPGLQGYQLADMEGLIVKARDGEDIPCYLSLPPSQVLKGAWTHHFKAWHDAGHLQPCPDAGTAG